MALRTDIRTGYVWKSVLTPKEFTAYGRLFWPLNN
jgi:hypothetical protein